MPNDETEQDRLDLHHEIMLQLLDGELHITPLRDDVPMRVLDIGTGTGIWAIDFADKYPNCQVLGTDLRYGQFIILFQVLRYYIFGFS